jgi:hypothetical protein
VANRLRWRVSRPTNSLPDDIDALRALASNAIAERDRLRDRLIEPSDRLPRLRKAQSLEANERLAKLLADQRKTSNRQSQGGAIEEGADGRRATKRRINRGIHEYSRAGRHQLPVLKTPMRMQRASERLDVILRPMWAAGAASG